MKNPVFTGAGVAIITPMYEDGSINFDVGGSNKRKDVCAMKVMVERILLWFGGAMAVLARYTATASVSSTCFYTAYQPDVPDEL